jgi:cell division protein FtsN
MHQLDEHIARLLEDHDCVIVPAFGGFVANYAAARVNPVSNRFDPPYRKISFNKHLVHNDGLLAAYVAQKEEASYEDALGQVKQYAFYLKDGLKADQKIKIDRVGLLYQHPDGTLHFEQVRNANFFKEGTGLASFFAKRLESQTSSSDQKSIPTPLTTESEVDKAKATPKQPEKPEPKVIPITTAQEPTETVKPKESTDEAKTKRRYWPVAAALIGLPLIGYAVWLSISSPIFKGNDARFQWSDLNPIRSTTSAYEARADAFIMHDEAIAEPIIIEDNDENLVLKLENDPDKTLVVRLVNPHAKTTNANADLRYHVVGGCFSMKSNADGLIARFRRRGNNAALIDEKGGLFRVSVQSFATKKEAKQYLASVRNEIPGAWLLYK